jgi:hypothetical protein
MELGLAAHVVCEISTRNPASPTLKVSSGPIHIVVISGLLTFTRDTVWGGAAY